MKILYVEDEILKHKDKIKNLFEPVLTRKIIRKLEQLYIDKFTAPEEIQEVLNSGNVLVVARTFPEAMEYLEKNLEQFALFIVDRNLSENLKYDHESTSEDQYFDVMKKVYPDYTEDIHIKYALNQREGDYLLEYLINNGVDCQERFYMLTANSDRLKNEEYIQEKMHFKKFSEENIVAKDNMESEKRLQDKITSIDEIMIRVEHPEIFLLEKYDNIRKEHTNTVVEVLSDIKKNPDMNQAALKKNFGSLRVVITGLLDDINKTPILKYHDTRGKVSERNRINWLDGNKNTALLKPYCDYIYSVTSDVALHEPSYDGLPTIHTLNSAICALKDIFYWIDRQLSDK